MLLRLAVIFSAAALPCLCEDWSPRLAAQYLDERQKEWFAWPQAAAPGGPCVSCHTGVTYLLARPSLRRALGESDPTPYEKGLMAALRARVDKDFKEIAPKDKDPLTSPKFAVESVLSALFLSFDDSRGTALSAETKRAFERLWTVQIREGKSKGAWAWFNYDLDPWETSDSAFYGAALAAVAAGTASTDYRNAPEVRERVSGLTGYLQREQQSQPLHNRLALLWAASKLPDALPQSMRQPIIDEVLEKQQADGGWAIESLGPWKPHPKAVVSKGSNSYATGYIAFMLRKAGIAPSHPRMEAALAWLRSHQDRQAGNWPAESLNKVYEPGSIPSRFMQDAATAFASLALLEPR